MEQTLAEKIDRARNGRTQTWIVKEMVKLGIEITDVQFSRKKKGIGEFTEQEIKALKKLINLK